MSTDADLHTGHRDRLRQSFQNDSSSLTDKELLELLLTYAIPRKDTAPLATELLTRFGSLANILSASSNDLSVTPGLGENTVTFLKLIYTVMARNNPDMTFQPDLFNPPSKNVADKPREIRVFADDEIPASLKFLPMAAGFATFTLYKSFLNENLPYNSAVTRQRRSTYILERYYPDGNLNTLLTYFTRRTTSPESLKSVLFFQLGKAEPILAKVASDLVFPALPIGRIYREQLREFILGHLPKIKVASQAKVIRSILNAYDLLGVGRLEKDTLKFQLHVGNLNALIYVLASEYPEPGIYSFESLFDGPAHRWLLWDREWIRKQLYVLRDLRIVSKVSEIDTVRQFSLEFGSRECLERFFEVAGKQDPSGQYRG